MSVTKQLIIYGQYLVQGEVKTSFLQICELMVQLRYQICELQLDLQKLCGSGSDGASVMLGVRGGISTLLKQQTPFLVAKHCIAHCLALVCGQAANDIPFLGI